MKYDIKNLDPEMLIKLHVQAILFGRVSTEIPEFPEALALGLVGEDGSVLPEVKHEMSSEVLRRAFQEIEL